ncbi:MAG: glycosyltransferase family 4 protein, partial [Anaerolineaceae bacterium]|nr:glycosyltransferase family 4 protein [Anaerolineaceae bacterium]
SSERSICILPALKGVGGPSSFSGKMKAGLAERGIAVHHNPSDPTTAAILVVAGTRHLDWLWQAKRRGVRIVQRLDGMNWVHRLRNTGPRHFLRSEVNNWILATIRSSLADHIVYQSHFSQSWWNTKRGSIRTSSEVIYNGVDLQAYAPQGKPILPSEHVRLLVVEGHLDRSHQLELKHALELRVQLEQRIARPVELVVAGDVSREMLTWAAHNYQGSINWKGVVDRATIPGLDRSAHLLFPVEINAACPNSVIEAIACGLPVVSFATGSLSELVDDEAGCIVPYGGNYWKLEMGNIPALVDAAVQVLDQREKYSAGARSRAERMFSADSMVEGYIKALLGE